ncbi:hypothetical protein GSI_08027 [Ganoderma sinense ZZ0214-1]|uniref:RRM domain-containing protein n=1 Tax=Ganoderma sinense ZZ0214-1 TaxID=1077348 RepID=A0A2G8S7R7_9APHY|nr:hypothetical protein GSI_08027 [Ganoderma sinense ZZ0214-1]
MAKTAAEKIPKVVKNKSQQDLKADAPPKTKTKQVEDGSVPLAVDLSPSKSKKKKTKGSVNEAEELQAAVAPGRKGKGAAKVVVPEDDAFEAVAEAKTGTKGKRKAAEGQDKDAEVAKETKKKRKSTAVEDVVEAPPAPKTKKSKSTLSVAELPSSPAKPTSKESKKEKKGKRVKVTEPQPEPESEDEEGVAEENEAEEEFYGFESDDDSSDEEVDDIPGIDLGKLPTIAKDDATVKRKLEKAKRKPTEDRGVLYLGRIPHGFYEDQMKAYFSQFGNVTRIRLSRNKKTGKPKHYGFVEFDSSSVARIVADTMDNYLLMGHILTCKVIPKDQVHPELWVGANRKWRPVPRDRVARVAHNKPRTEEELEKAETRLLKRQEQRKRKLEEAGIKYDFEAVAYKKKPKPTDA